MQPMLRRSRSRCNRSIAPARDVANALSEEHVNIVSCSTNTGADRVARMRFEFEFADPSHLQSVLRTIKRIDSVYDAYRVMAGDHPASNVLA